MSVLLALAAAVAFGVSDFLGGWLSRRLHFALVAVTAQAAAAACAWAVLPWWGGSGPATAPLLWGALSGAGGAVGSLALYRGLARGAMTVVAPLSAVGSAVLPVLAGVGFGERPSPAAVAGIVLALPAIWLVARPPSTPDGPSTGGASGTAPGTPPGTSGRRAPARAALGDGLLAGAGFALLFIGVERAGQDSGLWPVAAGQSVSLLLLLAAVLLLRPARAATGRALPVAGLAGLCALSATVLFLLASGGGLLAVVAVLTSLYPAVTVVLAALVLHERTGRAQKAGLAAAAAAVALIALR